MENNNYKKLIGQLYKSGNYKTFQESLIKTNKPNIFEILKIVRREVETHSNFLAWIFDPIKNHGLGDIFLVKFLSSCTGRDNKEFLNKIKRIETEYSGDKHKESGSIDILLELQDLVVCIENKIDHQETPGQLKTYKKIIEKNFPKKEHLYIYLTIDGVEPDDLKELFIPLSYKLIFEILSEIKKDKKLNVDLEVRVYLEAYIEILEQHILKLYDVEKLASKVYKENFEVLEYIIDLPEDNEIKNNFINDNEEFFKKINLKNKINMLKSYFSDTLQDALRQKGFLLRDSNNTFVRFTTTKIEHYIYFNKKNDWGPKYDSFLFELVLRPENDLIRFKSTIGVCDDVYDRDRLNEIIENMKDFDDFITGESKGKSYSNHHSKPFPFDFVSIFQLDEFELNNEINKILDNISKVIKEYEIYFEKNKLELLDLKSVRR